MSVTILSDFGEVISLPQPADSVRAMAQLCELEQATFESRYWEHRPFYDGGGAAEEYWSKVCGGLDGDRVARLTALDAESWIHLNRDTLAVLEQARARGHDLAVLSNAPYEVAARIEQLPELASFRALFFSARLSLVKPDPAIYETVARELGRSPEEIVFVDDRESNVEAARAFGMRGVHFTGAGALAAELP